MPNSLSAVAMLEKNKVSSDGVWLVLLEVQFQGETIRLVRNNDKIDWGGYEWLPFAFDLGDDSEESKGEIPALDCKVSNAGLVLQQYVEAYAGGVGAKIIIRVVHSKNLTSSEPELEETFMINDSDHDDEWVTFHLGADWPISMRFPLRRMLKDWCPFIYCDIECGLPESVKDMYPKCNRVITDCRARHALAGYIYLRFGGEPAIPLGGVYASNKVS